MGEGFDFKELGALNLCSFMYQATNAAFPSANTFGFHYSTKADRKIFARFCLMVMEFNYGGTKSHCL